MKITSCRACGAPIGFIKTVAGKTVPVDVEIKKIDILHGSNVYVKPDGMCITGMIATPDEMEDPDSDIVEAYVSHFATCPNADQFRKKRKSDRKKG